MVPSPQVIVAPQARWQARARIFVQPRGSKRFCPSECWPESRHLKQPPPFAECRRLTPGGAYQPSEPYGPSFSRLPCFIRNPDGVLIEFIGADIEAASVSTFCFETSRRTP